jgi:hypothetical protein
MTKLVRCDGEELIVYDLGARLYRVRARGGGPPIKYNGWRIVEDDEARRLLEDLRSSGIYLTERMK